MRDVTGATRLVGILADPIHHVRTPQVLNPRFEALGIDAVILPMHVVPADLGAVLAGLSKIRSLSGLVVTVPHKEAVVAFCDELGPEARLVGAANVLQRLPDGRWAGEMLDGVGFVTGLRTAGIDPAGLSVLLVGAGGAASAVAVALVRAGVARLVIANRTPARAEALAEKIAAAFPNVSVAAGPADPAGFDLVINGTSLGLKPGDALPLDPERLEPRTIVADVVMNPPVTPLLAAAAARGCRTHEGLAMIEGQLDAIAAFVTGG
ncbi:shikimate dehydrogenase family protein [Segnochrobactraceae bacterium EtOH-i3]